MKLKLIFEKITSGRHNFLIFVSSSIVMSFCLVVVSMMMYNSSGAAQLDLSRPGYVTVRSQAGSTSTSYKDYPATGVINQSVIDEFDTLFKAQSGKITSANVFSGDPLSPEALGIGAVF